MAARQSKKVGIGIGHRQRRFGTGTVTMADAGGGNPDTNANPLLDLEVGGLNVANDFVISNQNTGKTIRLENGGTSTGRSSGNIQNNETDVNQFILNAGADDTLTVTGLISGVGGVRGNSNNAGTVVLANAGNSFTRPLNVTQGTLSVASIADSGVASHAGAGSEIRLGINNSNGILQYTGAGNSTNRQVQVGNTASNALVRVGGGWINNIGTGGLVFTNANFNISESDDPAAEIGPRTLTLGGNYDGQRR